MRRLGYTLLVALATWGLGWLAGPVMACISCPDILCRKGIVC